MSHDPATAAPDWSRIPFDVACARCGHNLKGLTDPKCPTCELTFDWSDAVPVEELLCDRCGYRLFGLTDTRCPECGEAFTWDGALAARVRRKTPLFEYRWREQFVRSFISSPIRAMRPTRLWTSANLHDRPPVKPLALLASSWIVGAWLCVAVEFMAAWSQSLRTFGVPSASMYLRLLKRTALEVMPPVCLASLVWWLSSIGSLMVFRQSMRRYKVRFAHVLRVWCYSGLVMLTVVPAAFGAFVGLFIADDLKLLPLPRAWVPEDLIFFIVGSSVILSVLFAVWSVRCGYKHYVRMDHPLSVAVASQVIAVLVTLAVWCSIWL